jgi:hypothetical protein
MESGMSTFCVFDRRDTVEENPKLKMKVSDTNMNKQLKTTHHEQDLNPSPLRGHFQIG